MKIEHRALLGLEVREAPKDSGFIGVLAGYAAVFNSDSVRMEGFGKPWIERIRPGAFSRSLREMPDVRGLWMHRSDVVLARAPDTYTAREDETGLFVEYRLIDTQANRDAFTSVRGKLVDAQSFGFVARKFEWEEGAEVDVRTLIDVDLFETSPVSWPAYPATGVSARSSVCLRSGADATAELQAISEERSAFFAAKAGPLTVHRQYFPALRLTA